VVLERLALREVLELMPLRGERETVELRVAAHSAALRQNY
jgi:hypothetical protein